MKRLKLIFLVAILMLSLSACNIHDDKAFSDNAELYGRFVTVDVAQDVYDGHIYIIKDTETGVNYIYARASNMAALSPLYDSNGEIVVDEED